MTLPNRQMASRNKGTTSKCFSVPATVASDLFVDKFSKCPGVSVCKAKQPFKIYMNSSMAHLDQRNYFESLFSGIFSKEDAECLNINKLMKWILVIPGQYDYM